MPIHGSLLFLHSQYLIIIQVIRCVEGKMFIVSVLNTLYQADQRVVGFQLKRNSCL